MTRALTPLDFLDRAAVVFGDRTAVVDREKRLTYAELKQRVHRLASALRGLGVERGDRVAVLQFNSLAALEPHFAVPLLGAVLVMLNTRLQPAELAWILDHSGAKVLIADPELSAGLGPFRGGLQNLAQFRDDPEDLIRSANPLQGPFPQIDENAPISINYTSGTTGTPKGVVYTHRGAYLNALGEVIEHGLNESSAYLWTLPMFHCNGWCFPWAVTAMGARHVCLQKPDPELTFGLIEHEHITHLCGAPTVVNNLVQYCASRGARFERGLKIVTAAAPPPPAVIRAAEEIGAEVSHVYGLTETYGPHSICAWRRDWNALPAAERARLKARQGVSYTPFGMDLRVVDADMKDVPANGATLGEVVMRGNNVMLEYYREPEATAHAFRGGWFHSGDLAVMCPDGYIELRDRAKDIVISGGENISSIEVERALCEHPAVLEAAVVAVPDERWGEVPKAFVTLKPGHAATEEELIGFCRGLIAHFKSPKQVEFGTLPKTATGKVRKAELRARGAAQTGPKT